MAFDNALSEIEKERKRTVKDIEYLNHEIDVFNSQIDKRIEEIAKKKQLVREYDQIIEKLKGVTE